MATVTELIFENCTRCRAVNHNYCVIHDASPRLLNFWNYVLRRPSFHSSTLSSFEMFLKLLLVFVLLPRMLYLSIKVDYFDSLYVCSFVTVTFSYFKASFSSARHKRAPIQIRAGISEKRRSQKIFSYVCRCGPAALPCIHWAVAISGRKDRFPRDFLPNRTSLRPGATTGVRLTNARAPTIILCRSHTWCCPVCSYFSRFYALCFQLELTFQAEKHPEWEGGRASIRI